MAREGRPMKTQHDQDSGFLFDLERAAKGLSIGSDGPSVAELRRLFRQVESDFEPQSAPTGPSAVPK